MLRLYLSTFILFFKVLINLHNYRSFLKRYSKPGKGQKLLKRPLDKRFSSEIKGRSLMSREDIVAYFTLTAFSNPDRESFKEEMFVPLMLMWLWSVESTRGEEKANEWHESANQKTRE